jgi:hypothetical protein
VPCDKHGDPLEKAQMNFTDPDSRIMKKGSDYLQGYNGQAVVDEAHQIIVAVALTNQAPDQEHLKPLLAQAVENCEAVPAVMTADAGYWSEDNAAYCEEIGTEAYISTARQKRGGSPPEPVANPNASDARTRMRERLQTERGHALYSRRKVIVEPPFGQIKAARGLNRFLLRGLDKASGEWTLMSLTHNILKLFRATRPICT